MIIFHGTTEKRAKEIHSDGWDKDITFFCSTRRDYAVGYARRSWLSDTKDIPVLMTIETDSDNLILTNLTFTNGEMIIKNTESIKILKIEVLE